MRAWPPSAWLVTAVALGVFVAACAVWVRTPDDAQPKRRPPRDARRPN